MTFNIDEEHIKLIKVVNDDTFDYSKYVVESIIALEPHMRFLLTVLTLTIKYPQVELYLKNLLNHFTIEKLGEIFDKCFILHQMVCRAHKISLNAFEIIINHGANINIQCGQGNTAIHRLMCEKYNNHNYSILNLLIKHGADLNIKNLYGDTVLDVVIYCQEKLDEETKNCIMTLVDFGVTTCKPTKNIAHDFIEYYKNSTIKPAIKNEK